MTSNGFHTELRKDPTSGRWVLIQNRATRPSDGTRCPFCPGHEAETPPEIAAYRSDGQLPNSSEWLVRVIPERSPLLQIEGDIQREGLGIFDKVSGRGASEIVIERPDHGASWDSWPTGDIERLLWMYRERIVDLYRDPQIRTVVVFRRERSANSQVQHPFSRIIGAPIIFDDLRQELTTARQYFAYKQRCLYCDISYQERRDGLRVVTESTHFLVYTPFASRRPFETWVVPTAHCHRFEDSSPPVMSDLTRVLQDVVRRLHAVRPGVPLELSIHTAPNRGMRLRDDEWQSLSDDYHWHIEIEPNGPTRASLGGFSVNPVSPETAAKELRNSS
jgi:UDPglucose--hexose-1-phosphate uridylyltransferase